MMRKLRAKLSQVAAAVVLASVLHVVIAFRFRLAVDELPGLEFMPFAIFEMFFLGATCERLVLYLTSRKAKDVRAKSVE